MEGWKDGRMEGVSLSEPRITQISRITRIRGLGIRIPITHQTDRILTCVNLLQEELKTK